MFYTIYKITNNVNGKTYTGMHKTDNLNDGYMGSGKLIQRAVKKHGIENFKKEILFIFDNEEDMKNKEKEVVVIDETTYNLCPGGHGGFGFINKHSLNNGRRSKDSEEKRSKSVSLYRRQKMKEQEEYEHMKRISLIGRSVVMEIFPEGVWKGRNHKPETIEQMRISAKGKHEGEKNSQYGTCWITDGSVDKKIKKEELDFWIEKGYYKGRNKGELNVKTSPTLVLE